MNITQCGPPLLLPAVIQPRNKVRVIPVPAECEAKDINQMEQYIEKIENEHIRVLRNKVEELHGEKRKLYFEMNSKINTVRKFWRNHLVESDTRSG